MSLTDLLAPIRATVEAVLTALHHLLAAAGLDPAAGTTWLLAVALLVVVVRVLLLPLAVRSYRSGLRMRALAPEAAAIRERYRGRTDAASRQRMVEETAALHRRHGVRPLAGLLPLLVQVPLFLALVQALEHAAHAPRAAPRSPPSPRRSRSARRSPPPPCRASSRPRCSASGSSSSPRARRC